MKSFIHKTFEERLAEFDGEISFYDFDWGEDKGRERFGYEGEEFCAHTIYAEVFGDDIDMWIRSQGDAVKVIRA